MPRGAVMRGAWLVVLLCVGAWQWSTWARPCQWRLCSSCYGVGVDPLGVFFFVSFIRFVSLFCCAALCCLLVSFYEQGTFLARDKADDKDQPS